MTQFTGHAGQQAIAALKAAGADLKGAIAARFDGRVVEERTEMAVTE